MQLKKLSADFPDIKNYLLEDKNYKVSAAWLIENAGLKNSKKEIVAFQTNMLLFFTTILNRLISYCLTPPK